MPTRSINASSRCKECNYKFKDKDEIYKKGMGCMKRAVCGKCFDKPNDY